MNNYKKSIKAHLLGQFIAHPTLTIVDTLIIAECVCFAIAEKRSISHPYQTMGTTSLFRAADEIALILQNET